MTHSFSPSMVVLPCRSTVVHSNTIPIKEQQQPTLASFKERQIADESCKNPRDVDVMTGNLSRPPSHAQQRIPMGTYGLFTAPDTCICKMTLAATVTVTYHFFLSPRFKLWIWGNHKSACYNPSVACLWAPCHMAHI